VLQNIREVELLRFYFKEITFDPYFLLRRYAAQFLFSCSC
jgi:hypothetical protein